MGYQLSFNHRIEYDSLETGIPVEVSLSLNGEVVSVQASLDSGAAYSIFSRHHGEALGLAIDTGFYQRFSTATGLFTAWGHSVTLSIADITFDTMVFFADDDAFRRNVLGRYGGLDRLKIGLVDYDNALYLAAYDEN